MSPRRAGRHHCAGVDQVGTGAEHTADQAEIKGVQDAGGDQLPGRIIARDDSGNWAFVSLTPLSVQQVPALAIARCSMVAIRYARSARACDRTLFDGGDPLRPDCPRLRSHAARWWRSATPGLPALAIARCSMVAIRYARIARACDRHVQRLLPVTGNWGSVLAALIPLALVIA